MGCSFRRPADISIPLCGDQKLLFFTGSQTISSSVLFVFFWPKPKQLLQERIGKFNLNKCKVAKVKSHKVFCSPQLQPKQVKILKLQMDIFDTTIISPCLQILYPYVDICLKRLIIAKNLLNYRLNVIDC